MALSDCPKCWDTPCGCGFNWERYSLDYLLKHQSMIQKVIDKKQQEVAVAPVKVRICKSNDERVKCTCKVDDDWDCLTCGERVWIYDEVPEHNCPPGFKQ